MTCPSNTPRRWRSQSIAIAAAMLAAAFSPAMGQGSGPIRIGVLNDQGGPYSAITGPGSVAAARMAVQDLGGTVLGRPVEVSKADHPRILELLHK